MIIVMRQDAGLEDLEKLTKHLNDQGMDVQVNHGVACSVLGVLGDTHTLDRDNISMAPGVEKVLTVQEPFKKANRKFHPDNTVIRCGEANIGSDEFVLMAGPCSVESRGQIIEVAEAVKSAGARVLRGGAFKPRSSPYAFQGLEKQGLVLLEEARRVTGLPIVTEIMSQRHVEVFDMVVDIIQIGARNMQNFDLLKEVGRTQKPVLLKRGLSATIEEWLMAAEYIMAQGNERVILCERGIRTFETYTRNTLDISAIPAVKQLSHLPIVIDPSHATGRAWMAEPLAMAAIAAGADGLILEVHNDPANALCDGPQSVTPQEFVRIVERLRQVAAVMGRTIAATS